MASGEKGWLTASAAELGRGIAAELIDPVELADAFFDAIDAHPLAGRIYARLTRDRARAEAIAARERAAAGNRRGPLDGVPISWKDLFDTAGVATESGSKLLQGRVPDEDAEVLRRATIAGTVCLGKTHLTELAFSGLGINPVTATAPNRHDPDRAPGGSSSGAAASVAFDLAPAAIGSDTGGSVRVPSAWNDLVGLKTTWGLIPNDGVVPLAPGLDTAGPLCRTVEDAAHLYAILADKDLPEIDGQAPADLTLFAPHTAVAEDCDTEVTEAVGRALERLSSAGCPVTHGPLDALAKALDPPYHGGARVGFETWQTWGAEIEAQPGIMFPQIEARFRLGERIGRDAFDASVAYFDQVATTVRAFIADHGLLAMPTVPTLPPPVAPLLADDEAYVLANLMALRNTKIFNWLGLAAITLPTGSPSVGLMLVGAPGEEVRLLRAGRVVERVLAG
ncbi:MAG: amidase family protein [Pseudomonadota bacterium]